MKGKLLKALVTLGQRFMISQGLLTGLKNFSSGSRFARSSKGSTLMSGHSMET